MDRPLQVGIAWYRPERYPRVLEMMDDADRLPENFAVWLLSAEQVEREVARSGVAVLRIMIEPDAFSAWCAEEGLTRNGAARARFVNEAVKTRVGPTA